MIEYLEKYDFDPFKKMLSPKKPTPKNIAIVVLMIGAGILLIIHSLSGIIAPQTSFFDRFHAAFVRNQAEVNRYATKEFSPALGYLTHLINTQPQKDDILQQIDRVQRASHHINTLFSQSVARFPYQDFSEEEQEKIHRFFDVLAQINAGRNTYVKEIGECARMVHLGIDGGYDFCKEEQERWKAQSTALVQKMIASLRLTEKEEEKMRKMFGG